MFSDFTCPQTGQVMVDRSSTVGIVALETRGKRALRGSQRANRLTKLA
jgi:hypothetical protein